MALDWVFLPLSTTALGELWVRCGGRGRLLSGPLGMPAVPTPTAIPLVLEATPRAALLGELLLHPLIQAADGVEEAKQLVPHGRILARNPLQDFTDGEYRFASN